MTDLNQAAPFEQYPMLPLRDVVVFPHMVVPLFVGRDKSIKALEAAMDGTKRILLVAQRDAGTDDPEAGDIYPVGTLATVLQMLRLPDGTVKVLVEGNTRARIDEIAEGPYLSALVEEINDQRVEEREGGERRRARRGASVGEHGGG